MEVSPLRFGCTVRFTMRASVGLFAVQCRQQSLALHACQVLGAVSGTRCRVRVKTQDRSFGMCNSYRQRHPEYLYFPAVPCMPAQQVTGEAKKMDRTEVKTNHLKPET